MTKYQKSLFGKQQETIVSTKYFLIIFQKLYIPVSLFEIKQTMSKKTEPKT